MNTTSKKTFNIGLVPRLLIAIVVGILLGSFAPEFINRTVITVSTLFGSFLMFVIPLMILAFVTIGIANLTHGAGKLLGITMGMSYISILIAGIVAYFVSLSLFPTFLDPTVIGLVGDIEAGMLTPFFTVAIPPIFSVMPAIVLAFIFGLSISAIRSKESAEGAENNVLYRFFNEFSQVIGLVLKKAIIPLLPIFIGGTFVNLAVSGVAFTILNVLWKVILIIIALHTVYLFILFMISGFIGKRNPFTMMKNQIPAYLTALGTQSSAATIPINLAVAERNGISKEVRNFVIPFCATIHMPGSMISVIACVMAILFVFGMPPDAALIWPIILTLSVLTLVAPGAPGGAIMVALPFLTIVGIYPDSAMMSLLIALYIAQDSFGTACNVSSDNVVSVAIDTIYQKEIKQ
ncbi:MAG: dicarboxylate/amino acid:cation symporter [Bacteroidales bacterium]|nr:dicarboxylate/amino acid:cation symporter [Bacteroidales bacterium]